MNADPKPARRKTGSPLLIVPVVVGLLLFGVWQALHWDGAEGWFSPADTVRLWAEPDYEAALAPRTPAPLGILDSAAVKVTNTTQALLLDLGKPRGNGPDPLPGEPVRMLHPWQAQLGTATLELATIGLQTLALPSQAHLVQYYSPSAGLTSIAPPKLNDYDSKEFANMYTNTVNVQKPCLYWIFKCSDPDLRVLGFTFFDARTHAPIASGEGWGSFDGGTIISIFLDALASRPVTLVLRVARLGPAVEMPFTTGTLLQTPTAALRMVAMLQTRRIQWVQTNWKITAKYDSASLSPSVVGLVQSWPSWLAEACDMQLIDTHGKKINGDPYTFPFANYRLLVGHDASDSVSGRLPVARLRVYAPRDFYMVKFDLPAIPGLETRPMHNLFDQSFPEETFYGGEGLKDFIERNAQIRINTAHNRIQPMPSTKLVYRNATLGRMMSDYAAMCGGNISIDPITLEADAHPSWLDNAVAWLRTHGLWPK